MEIASLVADPPRVHRGGGHVFAVDRETLELLDRLVGPGTHSIETGLGASTVLFATRAARHVCVTGDPAEVARLGAHCAERGIGLSHVSFPPGGSQAVLPALEEGPFDVALIDGGHGFPLPFIDWFYIAARLRIGGALVIDDTQIWTCRVLRDFLREDPAWREIAPLPRGAAFELVAPFAYSEWVTQPYVRRRSRLSALATEARSAARMAARGEFRALAARLGRRLGGG